MSRGGGTPLYHAVFYLSHPGVGQTISWGGTPCLHVIFTRSEMPGERLFLAWATGGCRNYCEPVVLIDVHCGLSNQRLDHQPRNLVDVSVGGVVVVTHWVVTF